MRMIARLPLGVLYLASDLVYLVLYYIVGYRKAVVRENLKNSFPEMSDKERLKIEKRFFHSLCDVFIESFKCLSISDEEMKQRVTVNNCELVERNAREGYNTFMLLGHCGCWEWYQEVCRRYKEPKKGCEIYQRIHSEYFGSLMHEIRSRWDTTQVEMEQTVRTMLHWAHDGEPFLAGFISDQRPNIHHKGFVTFMSQITEFAPGAEEIARKIGARLVYLDAERTSRGHYTLTFRELSPDLAPEGDYPLTRLYFQMLEQTIRRQPEIWLWSHKRWYSSQWLYDQDHTPTT